MRLNKEGVTYLAIWTMLQLLQWQLKTIKSNGKVYFLFWKGKCPILILQGLCYKCFVSIKNRFWLFSGDQGWDSPSLKVFFSLVLFILFSNSTHVVPMIASYINRSLAKQDNAISN